MTEPSYWRAPRTRRPLRHRLAAAILAIGIAKQTRRAGYSTDY